LTEQDLERIKNMKIYGFEDSLSVARTLMGGIHENLLLGDLVFAYRSTSAKNKTELYQIVVVNELADTIAGKVRTDKFSISYISYGYSAYIPHMPVEYLDEVLEELEKSKADRKVVETFKIIIEDQQNRIKGGNV